MPQVAKKIKNKFKLKDVLIAGSSKEYEKSKENVGALTAVHLSRILENNMLLGFTFGKIIYYITQFIYLSTPIKVDVIQLTGSISNITMLEGSLELSAFFSSKFNGKSYIIQAPLMVKSKQLKDLLLQEMIILDVIKKFSNIDIAVMEINSPKLHINEQLRDALLTRADVLQLIEQEAVASICGRYFDIKGATCNAGINERIIGIDFNLLKEISTTIGVAAGINKLEAVLSILRSGYINTLIIDELLAKNLISAS
jgi:DNA-binding transcriptional regulator LsrR (DeoR family)